MIIDSHCHAWTYWPYEPPVPDPEQRGTVAQLLNEMTLDGVDASVVVCAEIDYNPENNAYIADAVRRHRLRLYQFADVDCAWKTSYHTRGAADRLRRAADAWPISGFTHYVRDEDDGEWFTSDEGLAFFRAAADLKLIASIACSPHHQSAIRRVAERFPSMPILIHHLGAVKADEPPPHESLRQVLASARLPNIYIKVSGFYYASRVKWDFPYSEAGWIVRAEYEAFGPHRMCWGSDYPVVRFFQTYRQSIECFRSYCRFIPDADKALILGENLKRLLDVARQA
jgi:L-fuconolactonase